jgi:hypothetical protein
VNDNRKFWKDVYKFSIVKATYKVLKMGDSIGSSNVVYMWFEHFKDLCSLRMDSPHKAVYEARIPDFIFNLCDPDVVMDMHDVHTAVLSMKSNHAPGADGLQAKAFIYGGQ